MTRLLLASASPARRATLATAGIDTLVAVSGVDEDAALAAAEQRYGALDPDAVVLVLARAKAEAVAYEHPDGPSGEDPAAQGTIVLGCDSMLEHDGEVLGKPADAAAAVARWRAIRGRSGTLHTGHWIVDARAASDGGTGATLGATSSTVVHFADLTDAEIEAYVATGEPLAVAGGFTIDGLGGPFVSGVEGDPHSVVGVSLPLLRELLGEIGLTVMDLWRDGLGATP